MKRYFALILAAVLVLCCFTGCRRKDNNVSEDPSGMIEDTKKTTQNTDASGTEDTRRPSSGQTEDTERPSESMTEGNGSGNGNGNDNSSGNSNGNGSSGGNGSGNGGGSIGGSGTEDSPFPGESESTEDGAVGRARRSRPLFQ